MAPMYECEGCGETVPRRRDMLRGERIGSWDYRQKYCTLKCFHRSLSLKAKTKFAKGELNEGCIDAWGYRRVKVGGGRAVKVHRYVMEQMIGRPLRNNENVHHKNGDRADNRPENLELWVKTQPCGQRVEDQVTAALTLLQAYPDVLRQSGFVLAPTSGKEGA